MATITPELPPNFGRYPMGHDLTRSADAALWRITARDGRGLCVDRDRRPAGARRGPTRRALVTEKSLRTYYRLGEARRSGRPGGTRPSLGPDAMTGMEAKRLRFAGPETMETRIFGRLTAWQNWIFNRPQRGRPRWRGLQRYGSACAAITTWNGSEPGAGRGARSVSPRPRPPGDGASRRHPLRSSTREAPRCQPRSNSTDRPRNLHPLLHLRDDLPPDRGDHP